jgi:hypothetical protein
MIFNINKNKIEEINIESITDERIKSSGYYVYKEHLDKKITGCKVLAKAITGLYLCKGSITPSLMTCPHKVIWKLMD